MSHTEEIALSGKVYLGSVLLTGALILVYTVYYSMFALDSWWLLLAGLTVVSSTFPVQIPALQLGNNSIHVTLADIFMAMSLLSFGAGAAILIALLDALSFNLRARAKAPLLKQAFNLAQVSVAAFFAGHLLATLHLTAIAAASAPIAWKVLFSAALFGFLYSFLSSGMVNFAIASVSGRGFVEVWEHNLHWITTPVVTSLAGAVILLLL